MDLLCRLFGHKRSKFTDSNFVVCQRCGMHQYWDQPKFDNSAYLMRPYWWIMRRVFYFKCWIRHKWNVYILKDDLPF